MTAKINTLDSIEPPIVLSEVEETALLFYLAGRVPLSVSELATECSTNGPQVEKTLNQRFQNEVKIDQTGFITLTDAARSQVVSKAKPILSDAVAAHKRGKKQIGADDYESAIEQYQKSYNMLSEVKRRLSAVTDVPCKLTDRLKNIRETHDTLQKEVTKDVLTHRKILAEQHEEEGDDAMQAGDYETAATAYEKAIDAFEEAEEAVNQYNDHRLGSSSARLNAAKVETRIEGLKRKRDNALDNVSDSSVLEQASDTPDTDATETEGRGTTDTQKRKGSDIETSETRTSTVDSPSKTDIIDEINRRADDLGRMPRLGEVIDATPWSQHDILKSFESWDDALVAAGIDKRQALIDDLKRAASEVDGPITVGEQNQHGEFSASMYYDIFDSWEEALAAADLAGTNRESSAESTPTTTEETLQPRDFASFDDMASNERYSGQLAIKIEAEREAGSKKDATLQVSDASGTMIRFDFWSKHGVDIPTETGPWYVVEEVRLKQWGDEMRQRLSSTRDTSWQRLDKMSGERDTQQKEQSKSEVHTQSGQTSGTETVPTTEDGETDESEGLLEQIESEFEEDLF